MTIREWKKTARILKEAYKELEQEALKIGIDIFGEEYKQLQDTTREKVLAELGFTIEEYRQMKEELSSAKKTQVDSQIAEVNKKIDELPQPIIPTKEDITTIAHEVAKEYIKEPIITNNITNQIVKETTHEVRIEQPKIVETVRVNKVIEKYNDKKILDQLSLLDSKINNLLIPNEDKIRQNLILDIQKEIELYKLPDFRKLAMGLQGQVDELRERDVHYDLWQNNDTSISPLSTTKDVVLDTNILKATTAQVNSLTGTNSASIGEYIKFYNTGILRTHATITYNNKFYGVAYTDKKIYVIDPVAGTLTSSTFTTTSTVIGQVVELGGYLYAIGDKSIIKFDPTTLSATTILVQNFGGIPSITTDGTYLYAVGYTDGNVYKYDTTGSQIATINPGYSNMHWIGYDSGNNVLLITTGQSPSSWIIKVDVSTFTFLDSASFLGTATDDNAIVSSNGNVYIGVEGSNNFIWKYEIADLANVSQIAMPHASYGLFYFGGNELYCGANQANTITILDLTDEVYTEYPMYETLNAAVNEIQLVNGYILNTLWGYNGVWARKSLPTSNTAPVWNNQAGTTDLGNTSTYDLTAIGNTNLSGNVDVGGYYHQNLSDPIDDAFHIYDALNDKTYARLDMLQNTMYFSPQVHIGENTDWEGDTKTPLNVGGNIDNFSQIIVKNINNGNNASSDLVAAASDDTTTALGHFTDVGILNPNYTTTSDGIVKNIMISNYGSGYTNGDIITISGGDNNCTVQLTVSGGVVVDWTIIDSGTGYSITKFAYPTIGGTGTDLTVNVIGLIDNNLYSAGDGYAFTSGGNLVISSEKEKGHSDIIFATDGTGINNERARINNDSFDINVNVDCLTNNIKAGGTYSFGKPANLQDTSGGILGVYGSTTQGLIFAPSDLANGQNGYFKLSFPDTTNVRFNSDYDGHLTGFVQRNIQFGSNSVVNLHIDNTNNRIGIKNTSPLGLIHPINTNSDAIAIFDQISSDTSAPLFRYRKARGSVGSLSAVNSGDALLNIGAFGYDGTTYNTNAAASIRVFAAENFVNSPAARGTYVRFDATAIGGASQSEVMRYYSTGLGIKTAGAPNDTLDVKGTARFGDSTTNYTRFESDGTMVMNGTATVYNDVQFNISSGKVPASSAPTWSAWNGLSEYSFAVNDYIDLGAQEFPHSWKEGTAVELHIHWSTGTGNYVSGDRVNWQLEYTWANMATSAPFTAFPTPTTVTAEQVFSTTVNPYSHVYTTFGSFTPTGGTIGAQLKIRLKRIAKTTGTDPGTPPFALQVGMHIEEDTLGSRTTSGK